MCMQADGSNMQVLLFFSFIPPNTKPGIRMENSKLSPNIFQVRVQAKKKYISQTDFLVVEWKMNNAS